MSRGDDGGGDDDGGGGDDGGGDYDGGGEDSGGSSGGDIGGCRSNGMVTKTRVHS